MSEIKLPVRGVDHDGSLLVRADDAQAVINLLRNELSHQPQSQWVSVDDRLPEFESVVLVAFDNKIGEKKFTTAKFVNYKYCAFTEDRTPTWRVHVSNSHKLNTVTHWQEIMPLPQPPQEDNPNDN